MDLVVDTDTRDVPLTKGAPSDFGARLREIRRRRKWTLQRASERTGIGLSSLSKIERNELSPTVTTLQRIAAGYEIDPATMMGSTEQPRRAPGRRAVTRSGEGRAFPTGTCRNAWLCPELNHKLMTPIMTTVAARSVDEYTEWARYDAEVFVHVLSGTMVVHSQIYEPTRLVGGDSMYYDGSTPHLWTSEGKEDARVLWLYAAYR